MTADSTATADAQATFRHVLGHFPSGVAVVTGIDAGEPVGLAVSSFTSVSLDPALVGFFPARTSSSWPRIERAGVFAVNVLGEDQEKLCRSFAVSGGDKFGDVRWRPGATGSPVLTGAIASIECELHEVAGAGDHLFVLGRVRTLSSTPGRGPLVFFRGGYARLGV
ncbi:flavin reductase family protein [Amycolatopsis roodepoortensis]|uniref:Flavin reductase (DIM6/NTAB) family NADH-FMN oxidoreductase RutF n=1 Tax=Amycolatopsis roodepoortensis TaxID=700274 RepID=A0ABR9LII8_9PSEU|nr:flavin reductase family protein [Amycolatopsis roodepoortensis]MBE1580105.1 flavin reductase (DIM6/NTAB) family NADH-FMN oxidoreductase RutF [Amycolatopsis roodepoortensis]